MQHGRTHAFHHDLQNQAVSRQGRDEEVDGSLCEEGEGPGTIAHYMAADGSCGVVVSQSDDLEPAYANLQNYTEWVEYDTKPVLKVEQAVPHIMAALS
jgi:hypothetical protein